MKRIIISTLSLFFLTTTVAVASSCSTLAIQINHDIHTEGAAIANQHVNWLNLNWLQTHLGYSGQRSPTHYHWKCPDNSDAFLDVNTDGNNQIIKVSGQYSSIESAGTFSVDIIPPPQTLSPENPKPIITKMESPIPVSVPIRASAPVLPPQPKVDTGMQQSKTDLSEWLNTPLKTNGEVMTQALKSITDYFSRLHHCTPGTYKYAITNMRRGNDTDEPAYFLATSTIQGKNTGACAVDYAIKLGDRVQLTKCKFSSRSLAYFTDETAKAENDGVINKDADYLMMKRMQKECQRTPTPEDNLALKKLKNYLDNFRQCIPGTYTTLSQNPQYTMYQIYHIPTALIERVSIISGTTNDKCLVNMTLKTAGKQTQSTCAYSPDSLTFLANEKTKELENELTGKSNKSFLEVDQAFMDKSIKAIHECTPASVPF